MEEELSLCDLCLSIGGKTLETEQLYSAAPIAPPSMPSTVNNKRGRSCPQQDEASTELTLSLSLSVPDSKKPIETQESSSTNGSTSIPSTVNNKRRRSCPQQDEASTELTLSLSLSVPDSKKPIETQESSSTNGSTLTTEEVVYGSPIQSRHNAHASTERHHEEDDHQVSSTNYQEDEISTELTLGHCDSRTTKKQRKMSVAYPEEDTEEDRRRGVSTTLRLCMEDPWKIRKKLTSSDHGNLSRLLLQKKTVQEHVLGYMSDRMTKEVESNGGARVRVWDSDTGSRHELVFKLWPSCQSYVLIGKWNKEFVQRRNLVEGDEIGLCWNPFSSIFHFRVLNRAPPTDTPSASSSRQVEPVEKNQLQK